MRKPEYHMAEEAQETNRRKTRKTQTIITPWYTVSDAARYLKLSPKTLYQAIHTGRLKAEQPCRKYLIHKHHLTAFALGLGPTLTPTDKKQITDLEGGDR